MQQPGKYRCGCGVLISNVGKAEHKHCKSDRHQKWLKRQQTAKTPSAFFVKEQNPVGSSNSSSSITNTSNNYNTNSSSSNTNCSSGGSNNNANSSSSNIGSSSSSSSSTTTSAPAAARPTQAPSPANQAPSPAATTRTAEPAASTPPLQMIIRGGGSGWVAWSWVGGCLKTPKPPSPL